MDSSKPLIGITMVRPMLDGLPDCPSLPAGYTIRAYRPGDEVAWLRIHEEADRYSAIAPDKFEREFGCDVEVLQARQFYLCRADGLAVGTITAWWDTNEQFPGCNFGLVHWVAIAPAEQGKGLSKAMLTRCLGRLKELGRDGACLNTQSQRLAAINLYLSFGFVPRIDTQPQRDVWAQLAAIVKGEFRPVIEAQLE